MHFDHDQIYKEYSNQLICTLNSFVFALTIVASLKRTMQNITSAAQTHCIYPGYVKRDLYFFFWTCAVKDGRFNQAWQNFQSTKLLMVKLNKYSKSMTKYIVVVYLFTV